jgi:hypothetical protein
VHPISTLLLKEQLSLCSKPILKTQYPFSFELLHLIDLEDPQKSSLAAHKAFLLTCEILVNICLRNKRPFTFDKLAASEKISAQIRIPNQKSQQKPTKPYQGNSHCNPREQRNLFP